MFKAGIIFEKNLNATARVVVNQGGTFSSKTFSILQVLFTLATTQANQVISVIGQDIPNLKKGALRDAQNIVASSPVLQSLIESYYVQDRIYKFKSGSILEFNSYDSEQDAKSGKRDYLFVNEANGIAKPVYDQLALRTRKRIFIDYNPSESFWVHEQIIPDKDTQLFISDHRHNPFISQADHDRIENIADKELWKVYARGLTGKIEGLIFPDVTIVNEIPPDAKRVGYGMDFGFTNDPTTFYDIYKHSGELYVDELIYQTGLTNPMIAAIWNDLQVDRYADIIADSAEPKSIVELSSYGYRVSGAPKGADSIKNGIDILKRWTLNITARSIGLRKEQKAYKWAVDREGKNLNAPIDCFNHGWDAVRYLALARLSDNHRTYKMKVRTY